MNLEQLRSDKYLIPISFACIYLIWGSTYLVTKWAFVSFPPFFMTATRLAVAGLILLAFSYKACKNVTRKQLQNSIAFGVLILGVGSGGSMWSLVYLDTGIASLMIGCEPLVLVIFTWVLLGQKPSTRKVLGVGLGMLGMAVLITQETIATSPDAYKGIIGVVFSILGWTLGATYMKGADLPESKVLNTSIQMIAGGVVLLFVSWAFQEDITTIPEKFTWMAFACLLYLIFFGSIIAYSAFSYLLIKEDPRKVATVTYVNPIIALFLGWSFNGEIITQQSIFAAAILISGVFFIIKDK